MLRKKLLHEARRRGGRHPLRPRVPNEGQHIRFSYATSDEAIEKGVARMAAWIARNKR
ncbi:MAG: hypothetical protein U0V87_11585 [Acidobacteriota bacterium]